MAASEELKAVVGRIPDPAKNGTYVDLDDAKIQQIRKVTDELQKGGRDAVVGLIDMLVVPGKGDDIKPRWALHLLAVRAGEPGADKQRVEFARAVASQLGGDRPKAVKEYLIEQLQVAGGKEVVDALGKALLDEGLCDAAARGLAAIGDVAAGQFLAALPKVKGTSRLSVIKKLAFLRVAKAADVFKAALADEDADTRIAGAWGIARIADVSAADALLKCAGAHQGWERINETDACMVLAEGLLAAGKKPAAAAIYAHLAKTRSDRSERHTRDAAQRGLAAAK